jgi:hypothetical protein
MSNENSRDCFCFPQTKEFKELYSKNLKDTYLAEKTFSTVNTWLAGSNKRDYSVVPMYATDDHVENMCSKGNTATCKTAMMVSEMTSEKIKEALDTIAQKCKCDD